MTSAGAARLGAFVADEFVPFAGEAATAYIGYSAGKDANEFYNQVVESGACAQ